ncbi:hypothetical protein PFISCL1PPCAC_19965 [Pristionchus fissidentatus]|uniref:Uncharacterized protein n=1 Tax=Pristionchus fissidentatus TaxID=1538716 RepID=A0AAV5WAV8_9BILA|nr:hypothetical protein PFISCL1PPCAC_19965 [Pristionchus fissidentatus]
MILQKSMMLFHLLEKEDYVTFASDVQKLTCSEQSGLVADLMSAVSGSFTRDASTDLEKALEIVVSIGSPLCRMLPLVNLAIDSKFDNLTKILLDALTRDFTQLHPQQKEWIKWDVVVKVDREIIKELDEEEEQLWRTGSFVDTRLTTWITFCDLINSAYFMRGSLIIRCYRSMSPLLVEYLSRIDPLSPIIVALSKQPFIFSPQYVISELADRITQFLSRKWALKRRNYVGILVTSLEFMEGMLKNEGTIIFLPQMERLLVALLPTLNDYAIGEKRRKNVRAFQSLFLSFSRNHQPLLLKRIIRLIKDQIVKVDAEAQILSFLVDLYRQQLVLRGVIDEEYSSCLAEFWAVVFIKYDDCSHASMFYQSLFLLAGLQARMNHRLPLLKDVKVRVLTPLQHQLSDYLQLRRLQDKTDGEGENIDLSFLPQVEDDSLVRLNISLRVMKDTFHHIHQALIMCK